MAQLDAYLVEKLREILERLYSKDKGGGSGLNQQNVDFEVTDSHHHQQQQQVTYKRSPSLFPYAPIIEEQEDQVMMLQSTSESEIRRSVSLSDVEQDAGEASGYFSVESDENSGAERVTSSHDYYGIQLFSANDSSLYKSNYSDSITYGVEVNCTTEDEEISVTGTLSQELDKLKNEDESSALTRNLHEFIHILKMSLKTGSSAFPTGNEELDSVFNQNSFGRKEGGIMQYGNSGKDISDTGGVGGMHAGMEFNLTMDDIMDLNNLLEGNDSTLGIPLKHILIIVTYMVIACVSIIGNLLVIQLVIRSRRFHTLTHALLSNLAVADLLLATLNIPFSAARVILTEWPFGSILCRTVPFVQVTSVYATSFTMAVIAMDRYQVIMNPLGKRLKCSQGILLVLAIWIVSASLSIPYALNHQVVRVLTVRIVKRCQAEFGSLQARQILTVATFLAQYLLPLLFTTASYVSIMKRLWHRSSDLGSATPRQVAAQSRAKRKTIKMLVLTVICFAISWAPINCYHLLTHFSHVRHNSTAILICHMIAMSSSMYNPFIFCGLNEHFRREAVKWLHCFRTRRSPVVHPGAEVNGMLARADQNSRRNMSTTVVHTTVSCRRSPPHPHHHISSSPRSCQRRRIMATASPPAAIYITPRHEYAPPGISVSERVEMSPGGSRLLSSLESARNGTSGSSSRYQPKLMFLVKGRMSSLVDEDQLDPDEMDSGEDVVIGDDFPDSMCEEWNSSGDYRDCRTVTPLERDKSDRFSLPKESTGSNVYHDAEAALSGGDQDVDDDENPEEETSFMGDCET